MKDLNSVLIEGLIQAVKPKKDKTGHWVEIRSRHGKESEGECASHRFRIAVSSRLRNCTPELLALGRRVRVIGKLDRDLLSAWCPKPEANHFAFEHGTKAVGRNHPLISAAMITAARPAIL